MYKTKFTDVGKQKLSFEITTKNAPTKDETLDALRENLGCSDVRVNMGRVYLPGKNPGNYLCYGSYVTSEI